MLDPKYNPKGLRADVLATAFYYGSNAGLEIGSTPGMQESLITMLFVLIVCFVLVCFVLDCFRLFWFVRFG